MPFVECVCKIVNMYLPKAKSFKETVKVKSVSMIKQLMILSSNSNQIHWINSNLIMNPSNSTTVM